MLDKHGISVLLAAIWEGHTDCVKTLLKNVSKMPEYYEYLFTNLNCHSQLGCGTNDLL